MTEDELRAIWTSLPKKLQRWAIISAGAWLVAVGVLFWTLA